MGTENRQASTLTVQTVDSSTIAPVVNRLVVPNGSLTQVGHDGAQLDFSTSGSSVGVDVSSFATGGDGSDSDPWTGWDTAITFEVNGVYLYPPKPGTTEGHYAHDGTVNFLKTNISHIGIGGIFLHHTGDGDAFKLDSEDPGVQWIQRSRVENLTILGHVVLLSGTATASVGTDQVVGTGTSFLTQIAVGEAIAFDSGTSNNETRLVTAIADNTHLTVDGEWTTNKSGTVRAGKTRHGIRMTGCRQAQLKNVTVHDVGHAALYSEWCVTNEADTFQTSYHDPVSFTEFQIRSQWGIKLDTNSTIWEFKNPIVEGTQAIGIYTLNSAYGHIFRGGTSEGNKGDGVFFNSELNAMYGTDLEANDGVDAHVWGSRCVFKGCVMATECFIEAGQGNRLEHCQIGNLVNSADQTVDAGCQINGTITNTGSLYRYPNVETLDGGIRHDAAIGNVIDWPKDLTPGSTVSTNARQGRIQYFTSSSNFTLENPTHGVNGQAVTWRITQGAAHTITYDTKFRAAPGKELPPMPGTGEVLIVTFRYNSTDDKWDHADSNIDLFSTFQASDISAQDINATGAFYVDDMQVLTSQQPTIPSFTDSVAGTVSDTLAAIPDPADTPASADALRDDLTTNVLPKIRNAISSLADKQGDTLVALRNHGLIAVTAPFNLANTIFYSEAKFLTYANGANVKKWRDRSGNGRHLAQSDPTKQPLFITGAIDSHPCVRFDGSNDYLISGAWSYTQPFCVSLVLKRYNNAFKYLYSSIDNFGGAMLQGDGNTNDLVSMYAGSGSGDPSGAIDSGVWYLVTAEYNTTSSKIYENGVQVGTTGNPGSQNGNGLIIGNRYDLALPSQIDLAAIVIYLTTERSNVETYLLDEYPSL